MEMDIKTVRETLGESQARFGERFGVDQSTVHRWETEGLPKRGVARHAIETFLKDSAPAPSKGEAA